MLSYLGDPDVDFVKLAGAFGVPGEQVTTPDQIKPAMQRAARLFADRLKDPRRVRDALDRLIPDIAGDGRCG